MSNPVVSTITPCFRMKKYLPLFLESLPKQVFFDKLEIVIENNKPDYEEKKLVKNFKKKNPGKIKHIIVKKVDPIGTSMNRCIKEASGDFLCIWNVDDLRTNESIEKQADVLLKNPDVGIVYGNHVVVDSFGKTEGKLIDYSHYDKSELTRGMILGPFFMFRKSLVEKAGIFDEQLKSGADFDLAIRLALHTKAVCAKGLLGYYLDEGKGASTRPNSLQLVDRTVIELRYGILDKVDELILPSALKYRIFEINQAGSWIPVSKFIPEYSLFYSNQEKLWDLPKSIKNKLDERRKNKIKRVLYMLKLSWLFNIIRKKFSK